MNNLKEVFSIAWSSFRQNKLRSILTLLGIIVGVFSIIVISTIITILQNSIESGLSMLGTNTFQIQKFPAMHDHHDQYKYRNRRDLTVYEYQRLKPLLTQAKYVGAEQWQFGVTVKYGNQETNPNVQIAGITPEAFPNNSWEIEDGRDIKYQDVEYSADIVLIGSDIKTKLFSRMNPVGRRIRIDGNVYKVAGVLKPQGQFFGESQDNFVIIPITTFQKFYGKHSHSINITVMSYDAESYDATIEAAIGYMRSIRKVAPGEENDFEIFSNESLLTQMNSITRYVKLGAIVISLISLLAAGVGIMNIMLVSVTERTREIGIRKAVGAKKHDILFQFITEAIILCLIGGIIGIILGVGVGNLTSSFFNSNPALPITWILIGLTMCILIGLIFGTYPAYKAAQMDPIEALRYE